MADTINFLIPVHRKLSEEDISEVLRKHSLADKSKLPKIKVKDPALAQLDVEVGDVVEITRKSFAGSSKYYRAVVN